ncbi:MAG: DUF2306 domain-containing protein [Actinomycetes bacterium]
MNRPRAAVRGPGWPLPAALIALSAVALVAGALRLVQLAGGPALIPADDRFGPVPVAVVVHILGAGLYVVVGAFQFLPRWRRRHPAWHRRAGRVLAVAGLLVAGSALWMTLTLTPKPGTGGLLFALRKGAGWLLNLAVAEWLIRKPAARGRRFNGLRADAASGPRSELQGAPR